MTNMKKTFSEKIKTWWNNRKINSNIFGALTTVQVRDKIDFSWTKSIKTVIQKIVFFILKFAGIAGIMFGILFILGFLIGMKAEMINFYFLFLVLFVTLNLFSVTFGLMKSLYYAEDNKVLVTYPVSSTKLFISKILVYLIFELKKSFDMLVPVSLGFFIFALTQHVMVLANLFWAILPLLLLVILTVLVGALLSIPCLFIYKLISKNMYVTIALLGGVVAGVVIGLVLLINVIPANKGDISLVNQLALIRNGISNFIANTAKSLPPYKFIYRTIVGETSDFIITSKTVINLLIMVGAAVALFIIVILLIKPFYFVMMTRTFEFDKKTTIYEKRNVVKRPRIAIVGKELKLVFRDFEISGSYLAVYILTPILLFLIDKVFLAMDIDYKGRMIGIAINIGLTLLPLLASSTVVATVYSREGRAAYIKKTKPLKPYFMLTAKVLFNLVLCLPSIIFCGVVFKHFSGLNAICVICFVLGVIGFEFGHIFFSASLDIMNPQNELYATEGSVMNNTNELKSTIVAFFIALLVSVISYFLLRECFDPSVQTGGEVGNLYNSVFIKIAVGGIVFAFAMILLFIFKIKAFYIDRQEASRE